MKPALEIKDLYYSYRNDGVITPILKGISLTIRTGEMVAIQGPSGSGKSTLLYLLGLLTSATSGEIKIGGVDVSSLDDENLAHYRNRNIGFVFQQFHLLPKTSVLENILLPTQYAADRGNAVSKAEGYAKLLGLGERLKHHPNQLSGGQQQRVAICRALMNDSDLILADEPTGNLDSKSAEQTLELLRKLNQELLKTVVIITHDNEVAAKCDRVIRLKDGAIVDAVSTAPMQNLREDRDARIISTMLKKDSQATRVQSIWNAAKESIPSALRNLKRNQTRTALTMIGISVGIAAVLSMITLGQFTKTKILAGYADLGVNTLRFYGYPNWDQKATDIVPTPFRFFTWEGELQNLKNMFPEIQRISPMLSGWDGAVNYGGKSIEQDIRLFGASEDALIMSQRSLLMGRNFVQSDIELKAGVCIIGYEIAERLFADSLPLGQVLRVTQGDNAFGCCIIGVLAAKSSNNEGAKPNLQVYLPFTFYQALAGDWWSSQIREVMLQVNLHADVEKSGKAIKTFFEQKYGLSGRFRIDSNSTLIAQMRRFLALFTVLLSSIAFVTLTVGGIGITNMMLVSVSERFREIGLRKALGATQKEIRTQFLTESMIVCGVAGLIGLLIGFFGYHLAIWAASKFVNKMQFEWVVDWFALGLSILSIVAVGILSGIFPALKAEKLEIIEALRSE